QSPQAPQADKLEEANEYHRRGEACYTGRGALQDYAKAREWYEKAAAIGHAEAEFRLGWLHDHARGTPRHPTAARTSDERAPARELATRAPRRVEARRRSITAVCYSTKAAGCSGTRLRRCGGGKKPRTPGTRRRSFSWACCSTPAKACR